MKPLKVLAIGDYSTKTGLGTALNIPLRKLTEKGIIDPVLLGVGLDKWSFFLPEEYQKFPIIPVYGDVGGKDSLPEALRRYRNRFGYWPDLVWNCGDIQRFHFLACPEEAAAKRMIRPQDVPLLSYQYRGFRHLAYFPLDGLCLDERVYPSLLKIVARTEYPVCCSSWTRDAFRRELGKTLPYIPHGVDSKIFYPVDKEEARNIIRERLELPEDAFIVGMIGTNQFRKKFEDFIPAMAEFVKARPNVYFYMHTELDSHYQGNHDLMHLLRHFDLTLRCLDMDGFKDCTDEDMRAVYGMSDVQVLLSIGEGFGIPPVYSRAMGIPCLVTDCTALSENCADDFEKLPVKYEYLDGTANLVRYITDTDILVKRLCELYDDRNYLTALGVKCQKFALKKFDYDAVIIPQWEKLLEKISRELVENPPAGRLI